MVISELEINVYDVMVPCERAVVLGGLWENPSVFKDIDTYVFYAKQTASKFMMWKQGMLIDILRVYYDNMISLTDMPVKKASALIRKTVEGE